MTELIPEESEISVLRPRRLRRRLSASLNSSPHSEITWASSTAIKATRSSSIRGLSAGRTHLKAVPQVIKKVAPRQLLGSHVDQGILALPSYRRQSETYESIPNETKGIQMDPNTPSLSSRHVSGHRILLHLLSLTLLQALPLSAESTAPRLCPESRRVAWTLNGAKSPKTLWLSKINQRSTTLLVDKSTMNIRKNMLKIEDD